MDGIDAQIERLRRSLDFLEQRENVVRARQEFDIFCRETFTGQGGWVEGWSGQVLSRYLERLEDASDPLDRLIVTMPPRHGKSERTSRKFPAWVLGRDPFAQIIMCAYGHDLPKHFSECIETVIRSEKYRQIFPWTQLPKKISSERWSVYHPDRLKEGLKIKLEIPSFIGAGIGGKITGFGGNYLLLDDPIKTKEEAESAVYREKVWDWYTGTFRHRAEKGVRILITMTRWHSDDLVARVLELAASDLNADQYKVLNFPAIMPGPAELDDIRRRLKGYMIEGEDPRLEGQALDQERHPLSELITLKATMRSAFGALFQGNPRPKEGNLFKADWFESRINAEFLPEQRKKVRVWDWAVSSDGDGTAGMLFSIDRTSQRYVEHIERMFVEWPQVKARVLEIAERDGRDVLIILEEIGKDKEILRTLKKDLRDRGFRVKTIAPRIDKVANSLYAQELAEAGLVTLVGGVWNLAFIDEATEFPNGKYDDQCDVFFNACNWSKLLTKSPDRLAEELEEQKNRLPDYMDIDKVVDPRRVKMLSRKKHNEKVETDLREILYR